MKRLLRMKLPSLIGIVLFAGIGTYLVFLTQAEDGEPWWHVNSGHVDTSGHGAPVGTTFSDTWSVAYSESPRPSPVPWRMIIHHTSNRKQVEYLGYTCKPDICRQVASVKGPGYQHYPDVVLCIDVTPNLRNTYSSQIDNLLTIRYKTKINIHPQSTTWFEQRTGSAPGTCSSPLTAADVKWNSGNGTCNDGGARPSYYAYACNDGTPLYPGSVNPGNDTPENTGDSTDGSADSTSNKTNSGGSGSSAKQQSDKPNNIPTSSSQGDTEQTELEPSPFFDGKQYEKGTNQDTLANTVSSTGKKIARTWPIVLTVLLLGGVAGFGYWKWRRR